MFYMLTATEVVFIKDLIEDLCDAAGNSYGDCYITRKDVNTALELLNKIEPIETEAVLELLDSIEEEEYNDIN